MAEKMTGYPSEDKPWLKYYTQEAISSELNGGTIYERLYQCNEEHQNGTALIYFHKKITYGKLFRQIEAAAKAFAFLRVEPGDVVSLCSVTTPETIYAFYALNKLGAISNLIDPRTSPEGIKQYLTETHTRVLVVLDVVFSKIAEILKQSDVEHTVIVSAGDSMPPALNLGYQLASTGKTGAIPRGEKTIRWPRFISNGKNAQPAILRDRKNAPAAILHTGGTTGTPKGVLFSDESYNHLISQLRYSSVMPERRQRFLNIMPPFIAYGLACGIHTPLCSGAQLILVPKFDPKKFDVLIKKYKPNHFWGVPTHFDSLLESRKLRGFDLSFLVCAGVGGDGLNTNTEERINAFLAEHNCARKVTKGYGMTELNSAACACRDDINQVGSVGIPFVHTLISAFKPGTQEELKYNEFGEICVSSPSVMLEYYNNPEETEKVLKRHADGRIWVHSGDIGYLTEDGLVFIVDRIKRMMIRADGFKVYPSVIESIVCRHDAVESCAVIGTKPEGFSQGMIPKAFLVLKQDLQRDSKRILDEIASLCRKALAEYMLPQEYILVKQLPLTPVGKIDYRALEDQGGVSENP